jgi:V8-like Glu-specific endopeptidase
MSLSSRRSRTVLVLLPLLALAVLFALVFPSAAGAQPAPPSSGDAASASAPARLSPAAAALVAGSGPEAEAQALEKFWTPERMRAARPADNLASSPGAASAVASPVVAGEPAKVDPAGPVGPQAKSSAPDLPSSSVLARTNGKVFFTNVGDGLPYVCSATVVNSTRKDFVWTAGHCVHGGPGGTWHQDWEFVPAYKNGDEPYQRWNAVRLSTRTKWINSGDFTEDIAAAVLAPLGGRKIVDAVGGQGIKWNYPVSFYTVAYGYPQDSPFDGEKLFLCEGTSRQYRPGVIEIYCDMTGGSSGGGWLRDINGQGWGYLNGVNSHGPADYMRSPYYGAAVGSLYNYVINEV